MKKSPKRREVVGHGAGGAGGLATAGHAKPNKQVSSGASKNENRLECGMRTLHDLAGKEVCTLTLLDDKVIAVNPSQAFLTAMLAAGYKSTPASTEVSRALRQLGSLSMNDVLGLFDHLLLPMAMSIPMRSLGCFVETMAKHLGADLKLVADEAKTQAVRASAANRVRGLFEEALDILLHGAKRKLHRNARQVIDLAGARMPWEVVACQEILVLSSVKRSLPTMAKLREAMSKRLGVEVGDRRLGEVLKKIGFRLQKGPPTYRKKTKKPLLSVNLAKARAALVREMNPGKTA